MLQLNRLSPISVYYNADIARQSVGPIYDFKLNSVPTRAQVIVPQLINLFRNAGQGLFPPRLCLVDGSAMIGAQLIWEAVNQHFCGATGDRSLDHLGGDLNLLFLGPS